MGQYKELVEKTLKEYSPGRSKFKNIKKLKAGKDNYEWVQSMSDLYIWKWDADQEEWNEVYKDKVDGDATAAMVKKIIKKL